MKQRVYETIEAAAPGNRLSELFDIFLISLICLNGVALVVGTVDEIREISPQAFRTFEIVSVAAFTVEYLLRVWSCTVDPRYSHPVSGRLRFAVSPLAVIDLLAILPFYIGLLGGIPGVDTRFLRAIRLLARVARLSRYSSGDARAGPGHTRQARRAPNCGTGLVNAIVHSLILDVLC